MRYRIFLLLAIVVVAVLIVADIADREMMSPIPEGHDTVFEVLYGDSVYAVAAKLNKEGILPYPKIWIWYARLSGKAEKIKAGEYQISAGKTAMSILDDMVKGNAVKYTLRFVEGWTAAQAVREIQQAKGIVSTLNPEDNDIILKSINADQYYHNVEGLFYPDTYQYTRGTKDRDILQMAYQRLIKELDEAWHSRDEDLPYKNPYEVLIMASIVEKESGVKKERRRIAGVFVERLKRGMRLQTDPTVIYGMGKDYKGNIRRKDLRQPTPYNTYVIYGLPPTPISLVSKAALYAAVHPVLDGSLFFVAKGNGYHVFSKTLEEHNAAVRQYQLRRNHGYRSYPTCKGDACNE